MLEEIEYLKELATNTFHSFETYEIDYIVLDVTIDLIYL